MDRMLLKNHKKRCLFFYFSLLCSKGAFMLLLWVSSWVFGKQIKAAILSECSLMYVYLLI